MDTWSIDTEQTGVQSGVQKGNVKPINIAKFLSRDGKVIQIPAKHRTRYPVLQYLTSKLEVGRSYTEREVNEILECWDGLDFRDELRRWMVDEGLLRRTADGRKYWIEEQEETFWTWVSRDESEYLSRREATEEMRGEQRHEDTHNIEA